MLFAILLPKPDGAPRSDAATPAPVPPVAAPAAPAAQEPGLDALIPPGQAQFIRAIEAGRAAYAAGANDLERSRARRDRAQAICETLAGVEDGWVGYLTTLTTTGDGLGVIEVSIAPDIRVGTSNNRLSDISLDTLVEQASPVFDAAMALQLGAPVRFSARFVRHEQDCAREMSITEQGAMREPRFIAALTTIAHIDGITPSPRGWR